MKLVIKNVKIHVVMTEETVRDLNILLAYVAELEAVVPMKLRKHAEKNARIEVKRAGL